MPRLWSETIEAHHRAVRDATLDATDALVARHGLASVTMSRIAAETGIGRATLYRYFADVEAVLLAWHERRLETHLAQLVEVRDRTGPGTRLGAVLEAYALMSHGHHRTDLAARLHRGEHVDRVRQRLEDFVGDLVADGVQAGRLRDDVPPGELAGYCLHALQAAGGLTSKAAVRRLVAVTLAGLRPPTP